MPSEEPSTQPTAGTRWASTVALLVILGLALALRLIKLDVSYWFDEILTHQRGLLTFGKIWEIYHPPVIYFLAHVMTAFGESEVVVRIPFVIAGLFGVIAMYLAGKDAADSFTGLVAALLLATSACHVRYSQDARYYGIVMLGTILFILLLSRCATSGRVMNWLFLAMTGLAGFYTHLTLVPVFAAGCVGASCWILFSRRLGTWKRKVGRLCLLALCAIIVALPNAKDYISLGYRFFGKTLAPLTQSLLGTEESATPPGKASDSPENTTPAKAQNRLSLPQYLLYFRDDYFPTRTVWEQGLLAGLGLVGLGYLWARNRPMACTGTSVFFLVPALFFLMQVPHEYRARYFTTQVPVAILLIALGVGGVVRLAGRAGRALVPKKGAPDRPVRKAAGFVASLAVFCALACGMTPSIVYALGSFYANTPREDWKGRAAFLAERASPSDVMVYWYPDGSWRNIVARPLKFYMDQGPLNYGILDQVTEYGAKNVADIRSVLRKHPNSTVWIVGRSDYPYKSALDAFARAFPFAGRVPVRVIGEPTRNLAVDGGFEGGAIAKKLPEGAALTGEAEAFSGKKALRLHSEGVETFRVSIPIEPAMSPEERSAGGGGALRPDSQYTLSLCMKCRNVDQLDYPSRGARVVLQGTSSAGPFTKTLIYLRGTRGWKRYTATVRTGVQVPESATDLTVTLYFDNCRGELWVDEVQFEEKDHATPWVNTVRGPHK